MSPDGDMVRLRGDDLSVGYRSFSLPEGLSGSVICEAIFGLARGDGERIRERAGENLAKRKASQPLGAKSLGCVFKNPGGRSAGELIDLCGLKGRRIGGAEVSRRHANFIVNAGGATSRDVRMLADEAREKVREKFGADLRPEIGILDADGKTEDPPWGARPAAAGQSPGF
jgi:UDP-N-acetylmuramate dehydrogenase